MSLAVSPLGWLLTGVTVAVVIVADLVAGRGRRPSPVQAGVWVGVYLTLAIAFGIGLGLVAGVDTAVQFFAGYLTEYSLSVDNLFVFGVVMAAFAVPAAQQARVLLIGIAVALVLRGLFILAGAAAIDRFSATFYVFGAFLIVTAVQPVRHRGVQPDIARNPVLRLAARILPTTPDYHGTAWTIRVAGRRLLTPMATVIVAIALCDVMFALDSIPAIFGLTQEPYVVFTANAFALMGLRQLYFLLGGLLDRLVYLSHGLALILAFIGVKLIAHDSFPNVPQIPVWLSLTVIVTVLATTTIASLAASRRMRRQDTDSPASGIQPPAQPVP
ncbi:TerC/Alx family metal homeostasis membrane protein [Nonomuraea turkmeniaca]|uniref:TerC/Alx family metal homeostasis membrane protein n=1 Tax=Nonomuraea turkmeniaca TaxID=103838 RepID=A0A5S4F6M5_9ACTN|nr:TerC/Alx family metal homeostasis membrane protein [Nonomuraea turkmeniaca]TMR12005.1 TerC/Alx family metal homeostasis membrane protein [Nonomuraea turkmeniaca]